MLDDQQTLLLEVLDRAAGAAVSCQELREAGVEYPASVAAELELAGLPLERSVGSAATAPRLLGLRLDPRRARTAEAIERDLDGDALSERAPDTWLARQRRVRLGPDGHEWLARQSRAWLAWMRRVPLRRRAMPVRWLAPVALLAATAVVAAVVVDVLSAGRRPEAPSAPRAARPRPPAVQEPRSSNHPRSERAIPAVPVSPELAERLEARGHALLQAGELQAALPILRRALAATGEALDGCLEPSSEPCLTYAYALYDLGRALRLDRRAAEAVPILERRLQIANQRPVVAGELQLAREAAARPVPSARALGPGRSEGSSHSSG